MEKLDKTAVREPRFPLRPAMRIRRGNDFQRAYRRGSRARGNNLIVVACPNGLGFSRIGLSVGKRIWKQAVRRNRIRRIFKEAFRLVYPELPEGYDFVLIPAVPKLRPTLGATRSELTALGRKAARRAKERHEGASDTDEQRVRNSGSRARTRNRTRNRTRDRDKPRSQPQNRPRPDAR